MNIYVGNLSRDVTEEDLRQTFEAFGKVESVTIIKDKFSGESRGFGFVEMPAKAEAQSAITGVNGKELKGRPLKVNEARPSPDEGRRGGGRRGGERRF
jgi:RNA recognition motif-containing protein